MNNKLILLASIIIVVLAAWLLAGCGTIVNGSTQDVTVDSSPVGALAKIDNGLTIATPAIVQLERKHAHTIIFHKDGYQDQSVTLSPNISGWVFGNLVWVVPIFDVAGVFVDSQTGGLYTLSNDSATASLAALSAGRKGTWGNVTGTWGGNPTLTCWKGAAKVSCP